MNCELPIGTKDHAALVVLGISMTCRLRAPSTEPRVQVTPKLAGISYTIENHVPTDISGRSFLNNRGIQS